MSVIAQLFTNIFSLVAVVFFVHWSGSGNLNNLLNDIFQHHKISTLQKRADHYADITYYYAIFIISLSMIVNITRFVRKQFNQAIQEDTKFVLGVNKIIQNSLEHFLLFSSIYVYIVQKQGSSIKQDLFLLIPLWFFLGRIFKFIQLALNLMQNKMQLYIISWSFTLITYLFMLAQILGFRPLKYL